MKFVIVLFALVTAAAALHVRIPAANNTVLNQLYASGITVGYQGDVWWDVYLEHYKLPVLSAITTYEEVVAKKAAPDFTGYMNHTEIKLKMYSHNMQYQSLFNLYTIGSTNGGNVMYVARITQNNKTIAPTTDKRKIRVIGNVHGDETVGREIAVRLMDYLLGNYSVDANVTELLDNYEIHILPSMNPDGYASGSRTNKRGFDLNRNFPDMTYGQVTPLQPETSAVMTWSKNLLFSMALNFHAGEDIYVAHPPFRTQTPTPDDAFFNKIGNAYGQKNNAMKNNPIITDGVTRGADLDIEFGTLEDWDYDTFKTKTVSVNLSVEKHPAGSTLDAYWEQNRAAIIAYLQEIKEIY
jgi:hypothetical protein